MKKFYRNINPQDKKLIKAAIKVIKNIYQDPEYCVGAAILCQSGKIYSGVGINSCGYGPCAEAIALGTAISNKERKFKTIVTVDGWGEPYPIKSPCGNCRQMLLDFAPSIDVILEHKGEIKKIKINHLLPDAWIAAENK